MMRTSRNLVGYVIFVLLAVAGVAGCASTRPVDLPTAPTGTAIAKADGYVANADSLGERAKPYAKSEGQVLLDAQHESHNQARAELRNAAAANDAAGKQVLAITADRDAWKAKYDKLYGSIGATIERWFWRFLIGSVVGWVLLGTAGTLLTAFIPAGPAFVVGREILGLLPFANVFTNVSRWIEARRALTASSSPAILRPPPGSPIAAGFTQSIGINTPDNPTGTVG